MKTYEKILLENKAWALEKKRLDPEYFERLNRQGLPKILWIGSTDSKVQIREITNTHPGEIIAYRNLANLVKEDCNSFMSVLRYALYKDKIEHIIICGHNHCSGIREVLTGEPWDMVEGWLTEVNELYLSNIDEFEGMPLEQKEIRLAELNVKVQIQKLQDLPEIQQLWKGDKRPKLHGWVYNCDTGLINSLVEVEPQQNNHEIEREIITK
jgi:carbonic anhydrase